MWRVCDRSDRQSPVSLKTVDHFLDGDPLNGDSLNGDPLNGNSLSGNPLNGNSLNGNPLNGDSLNGNPLNDNPSPAGERSHPSKKRDYNTRSTPSKLEERAKAPAKPVPNSFLSSLLFHLYPLLVFSLR